MAQATLALAGPLLGAGVVLALGTRWALTLDSVSFALAALAIALVTQTPVRRPRRDTPRLSAT